MDCSPFPLAFWPKSPIKICLLPKIFCFRHTKMAKNGRCRTPVRAPFGIWHLKWRVFIFNGDQTSPKLLTIICTHTRKGVRIHIIIVSFIYRIVSLSVFVYVFVQHRLTTTWQGVSQLKVQSFSQESRMNIITSKCDYM